MIGALGGTGGGVWSPFTVTLGVEWGVPCLDAWLTSYTGGTRLATDVSGEAVSDRWSVSDGAFPYFDSKLGFLLTGFEYGFATAKKSTHKFLSYGTLFKLLIYFV